MIFCFSSKRLSASGPPHEKRVLPRLISTCHFLFFNVNDDALDGNSPREKARQMTFSFWIASRQVSIGGSDANRRVQDSETRFSFTRRNRLAHGETRWRSKPSSRGKKRSTRCWRPTRKLMHLPPPRVSVDILVCRSLSRVPLGKPSLAKPTNSACLFDLYMAFS